MSAPFVFGRPLGDYQQWVEQCFRMIEQSSQEDIETVIDDFTLTGTLTELRTINAGTATLAELRNFVCTLVNDIKKGGQKRAYGD